MPKSTQKPADTEQTTNQRGKSRFGSSGRSARIVLPERPPRAVDNEIVSILLGADPASLTEKATDAGKTAPPELAEAARPSGLAPEEAPFTASADSTPLSVSVTASSEASQSRVPDFEGNVPRAEKTLDESVSVHVEEVTASGDVTQAAEVPAPARRHVPEAPAHRAEISTRPAARSADVQDRPISSFEEFAERWRHGLRKGQLKICEVLYQKTYAVGQTECVTSFSELGRLSGLKMRQCFNVIAQLEALKFVERSRSAGTSNKKDQGSVVRFYLFPIQ
jgi:hypothetical protein